MTLLNWCGGNYTLDASAQVGFAVGSVISATTGASLRFDQESSEGTVVVRGLALNDVEVLVFHPQKLELQLQE
jgi:hypothetical protein